MTGAAQPSRRPAGRVLVLLVLTVLVGLLGMHAVTAGGVPPSHAETGHRTTVSPAFSGPVASHGCSHSSDDTRRLAHADATCAAAGVASPYSPPALSAALVTADASSEATTGVLGSVHGRAPPELSELQLLRI